MAKNLFDIPKKQWKHWSPLAQQVFNEVYAAMVADQELFLHPNAYVNTPEQWTTTAWNAAWTAADAVHSNWDLYNERV